MITRLLSTGAHAGAKNRRRALQQRRAERHEPVEEDLEQEDASQRRADAAVLVGVDRRLGGERRTAGRSAARPRRPTTVSAARTIGGHADHGVGGLLVVVLELAR